MIHTDRVTNFLAEETKRFLLEKDIATSKRSRCHLEGNGQVEKLNGTLWKAIQISVRFCNMKLSYWEDVLPNALHSIRSLLCTTMNVMPHERLFKYTRTSTSGTPIPTWAKPGPIYIRNHTKSSKYDPPVTPATLLEINPHYAHEHLPSGVETTVNVQDIAPKSPNEEDTFNKDLSTSTGSPKELPIVEVEEPNALSEEEIDISQKVNTTDLKPQEPARRSPRIRKMPSKYKDFVT